MVSLIDSSGSRLYYKYVDLDFGFLEVPKDLKAGTYTIEVEDAQENDPTPYGREFTARVYAKKKVTLTDENGKTSFKE